MIVLRQFNLVIAPQSSPWPTLVKRFFTVVLREAIALDQRTPASINLVLSCKRGRLVPQATKALSFFEPITAPRPCAAV